MNFITFTNSGYNVAEPPNIHFNYTTPRHLFLYFQSRVTLNGKIENPGTCIFYTSDCLRDYISMENFVNSYVSFSCPSELFSKLGIKTNRAIYPVNCGDINDLIFKICSENATREKGFEEKFQSLILDLLVTVSRGTNRSNIHKESDLTNSLSRIRASFLADVSNPPNFNSLLKSEGISRTQGYKLYSKFFHSSPNEDLIWARLEKARNMLRSNPDMKIYEVITACGFSNTSNFFRTFKSRYGYTPKDYAAAFKNDN